MGLAAEWWFWLLVGAVAAGTVALARGHAAFVDRMRRLAVRRGLISLPPGRVLAGPAPGALSDPSWLAYPLGAWVVASPWIWGYENIDGAMPCDVVTGSAVVALALLAILFPALWALQLMAGLWLVTAPWLVGYGGEDGPVGLSDTIAGVLLCGIAIASLATAERRLRSGPTGIGRLRR
jgi:SPW repeat-containing protein